MKKYFFKLQILILLQIFVILSQVQAYTIPELSDPKEVGRIVIYPAIDGMTYFLPLSFESKFECIGNSENKTCVLEVFNRLSPKEKSAIDVIAEQSLVTALTNFDAASKNNQNGDGVKETLQSQYISADSFQSLKNLNLSSGKSRYGVSFLRVPSQKALELQEKYNFENLGIFQVDFSFKAKKTHNFIKIKNGRCLSENLSDIQEVDEKNISDTLKKIVIKCELQVQGFDQEDAEDITIDTLKKTLLQKQNGVFSAKTQLKSLVGSAYTITNIFDNNILVDCQTNLEIKVNGIASTSCEEVENENN